MSSRVHRLFKTVRVCISEILGCYGLYLQLNHYNLVILLYDRRFILPYKCCSFIKFSGFYAVVPNILS